MVFYSAVVPQMIVILLLLLFMVTAFNMLDEYYDKYFSLYSKIEKLIDDKYYDDDYDKWATLKSDMTRNHLNYTINPRKIKKSIDYLYNNYNFFPEIKQEAREAKLKQLV